MVNPGAVPRFTRVCAVPTHLYHDRLDHAGLVLAGWARYVSAWGKKRLIISSVP